MTTEAAKKRALVRRKRVKLGDLRRGAQGEVIMDFARGVSDIGAPEIFVTGLAKVTKISDAVVRVTLYSHFESDPGAPPDKRAVVHLVWDIHQWSHAIDMSREASTIIAKEPSVTRGDGRRKDAH